MVASESVALEGTGHTVDARRGAGRGHLHRPARASVHTPAVRRAARRCNPCMFEYVYLARPDSVMDGISVYQARLNLGETLAQRVISTMPPSEIDVVIPIPESSRPSAMQLAQKIGKPVPRRLREEPLRRAAPSSCRGRRVRKKSVRQKLNAIGSRIQGPQRAAGRRLDRARHHQQGDRADGARGRRAQGLHGVAPRRRCASPTSTASTCRRSDELIAHDRSIEEIREFIGADALIYQDVDAMKRVVGALNPTLDGFEASLLRRRLRHRRHHAPRTSPTHERAAPAAGRRRRRATTRSRLALQSATEGD